jgi:glycosyltransferase involved in cell wall biosynthesis
MKPLISICIPAYKNASYLKQLLLSIQSQTFRDFEVVITDDSPDNQVEELVQTFAHLFPLSYQKNSPAKGSPANWNEGIKLAQGDWIKIMHDDDWFASNQSLASYADAIQQNPNAGFIFSAFADYEKGEFKKLNTLDQQTIQKIQKSPLYLFKSNYIGNPSNVLLKNNRNVWYDEHLKWVVDFEFYMQCLANTKMHYIEQCLINVGYNDDQITKAVFRNKAVEIPENIYMLNKLGTSALRNLLVFDYYWRLFRNLNCRDFQTIDAHLGENILPAAIIKMLQFQFKIPLWVLKIGYFSKPLMYIAYIRNYWSARA